VSNSVKNFKVFQNIAGAGPRWRWPSLALAVHKFTLAVRFRKDVLLVNPKREQFGKEFQSFLK
jgi:hypothetical protein